MKYFKAVLKEVFSKASLVRYAIIAVFVALEVGLIGCSSSQIKTLDTELEVKGQTQEGTLGIKDKVAIIQKETSADDELRFQQWQNNAAENDLNDEYFNLKRCRDELSDSRLGGNGQVTELPEIDKMKTPDEIKEEFGLTEKGTLSFVRKQDFLKKLDQERAYGKSLALMKVTVRHNREVCERAMGQARVKAGLPATRFQGRASITPDGNIGKVFQRNENTLDDAFSIKAELQNRKPASE